jgi:hypothetical protein
MNKNNFFAIIIKLSSLFLVLFLILLLEIFVRETRKHSEMMRCSDRIVDGRGGGWERYYK